MTPKKTKTDAQWREQLTPEQYRIMREKGTEPAFSGRYCSEQTPGDYLCAACGERLFDSEAKYDSGSGWPSFWQPVDPAKVERHPDSSHDMHRVEVTCSNCGAHLGHLFPDGPPETTGERYCINSAALDLQRKR